MSTRKQNLRRSAFESPMQMKTVIYLSTALTEDKYNSIVTKCNSFKPTYSGVGFDANVLLGVSKRCDVLPISYMPLPNYPKYATLSEDSDHIDFQGTKAFVPGICALPKLKEKQYGRAVFKYVSEHFNLQQYDNTIILCSGLYSCFLQPAVRLKKQYGFQIYVIVPDVPEIMRSYRKDISPIKQWLISKDIEHNENLRSEIDGFVFLSSQMNDLLNKCNKPFTVVDGLCNLDDINMTDMLDTKEKFVLYAGKVSREFGVDKLVESFGRLKTDYRLYVCGDGDYSSTLRVNCPKNVEYLGLVSHKKVLQLEKSASILVDPRPSTLELTKYSFPSKIIEYMASGTPVLNTNLPCFAPEYASLHYRFEDESIEGIMATLTSVLSKTQAELSEMGERAKCFVMENKTIQHQCDKIINFIFDK